MNIKSGKLLYKKSLLVLAISSGLAGPAFAQSNAEQNITEKDIEVITIKGRAAQFYFVDEATMATKTPTKFMDLPQSVQVLSNELMLDQAVRQTTDLYRSISGVTQFSYSGINARGFRQDQVRYDGVQGDPYSGFSIPQLFNIERVEVLKGPTGMLYGAGQPGGLLNYVTKKPKFEQTANFALFTGNDSLFGGNAETTGTLNEDETLAYRVGGFYQSKDGFRNNTDEKNTLLSAGLTWLANDKTELIFQYDYIDQDLGGHRLRGVPVDDNGNFLTDLSYNANEKSDFQRLEADVFQVTANIELADDFTNTTVIRALSNERNQQYHENAGLVGDLNPAIKAASLPLLGALGFPAEDTAMLRQFRDQKRKNDELSITTDFVYESTLSGLEHTLLFGFDYSEVETEFHNKFSDLTRTTDADNFEDPRQIFDPAIHVQTIDILNPVYGVSDSSTYKIFNRGITETKSTRLGVYVQDQIRINEQWIAIAGARFDQFEDKDVTNNKKIDDNKISPRLGAIYQPSENMSIFANRAEGFNPQRLSSQPDIGEIFDPETSTQHEIGIKNIWLDGSITTTFATYHIVKEDVKVANPNFIEGTDGPAQIQIGEVTSKGIEIDVVGDITEHWTGMINYAYNDAKITGGNPDDIRNAIGDEFANAPDHTLGMWTRYELPSLNSSFAVGFDFVDDRISLDGQKVKSYTTWDASWQTQIDDFQVQLNLKNIFDKEYATSGFNKRNGHFPGEPRSILLQVSYSL
ncbi:TonB-dependent siderophore receptor [Colwellia sp. MB3u-55]|uniref:TonB-dependent siderophore receptor n=1 Tax=Colwellia sp. MB3u-55 TaxID=2759810 RepID=UPI0028704D33|nr:TonB-dependent siderophore receptor [Colwellia sp. MB3u-55]